MPFKRHKQYRLPGYDYSSAGAYFITICTANRQPHFGHIGEGKMHYTAIGQYVAENLEGLEARLPHLQLDEWEIMPDHVHLVLTLHPDEAGFVREDEAAYHVTGERAAARRVPTAIRRNMAGLRPLASKSVASFVNHFKGRVSRYARFNNCPFEWQARFHDRIIRDYAEYRSIISYVQQNVQSWQDIYNLPAE